MSSTPRPLAGPRRLILIQSGKYDYAELDLTQPFQLVGVNGLGKTALISTLQYLYLDSQRDMRFGQHSTDDSRKFYFKSDASFILFECETSLGTVTLGARGLGAAAGYELQRFAWNGSYSRADFIDSDGRPKRWDDVRADLGGKDLQIITETADLRRLLGAVDDDTATSWNLVPLADARDYPRFRQTFQRLLQLRDIRQDDLKQLLADCAKLAPAQREIDLAKDFETELARIARDRDEIARLRKAEPLVREVRALYDQERVARAIAHAACKELQSRHSGYAAWFKSEADALYKVRDDARIEFERLEKLAAQLRTEWRTATEQAGFAREKLNLLAQAQERFASFELDLEEQIRDRLNDEVLNLHAKLSDVPKETLEVLNRQLTSKNLHLKQLETSVARLSELFITWLRKRLPEENIARLGALFDRRVLESVMDEQIHITDETAFIARLKVAAERCDVRGYEDDVVAIEFPSGSVSSAGQIGKLNRLQEDIRETQREIVRLERNIHTLQNVKPLQDRFPLAQKELEAQNQRITEFLHFREEKTKHADYETDRQKWTAAIAAQEAKMTINEAAKIKASKEGEIVLTKIDKLAEDDRSIRREAENVPMPSGDDPGPTPVSEKFIHDLPNVLLEVFRIVRSRCSEARNRADTLDNKIGLLDRDFLNASFRYDHTAPVEERLRQLEAEIASLPARTQNIESRWVGVLMEAKRSFHTMLKSLDDVTKQVRKLNGELSKIEFSSIAEVRLEVVENQSAVSEYERHSKDAAQPSLFDTAEEADRKLSQFTRLLQQRPKLVLNDLFSLRCEVRRKDGLKNFYDDFDQVESTGTTIVLKVTLNLLVLRDLLIPGKARIPYYLDEVHALDRQNFTNILQLSERLGFVGIYAAPTAAIGPRRFVHLVPDIQGRLVVTAAHQKDIVRAPEDTAVISGE